ncbi:MAG: hypothetical protein ACK52K_15210 [Alphaproteobacteria bacterium]|jgi:hypothetical protein
MSEDIKELVRRLRELGATNSADAILTLTARAEAAEAERDRLKAALDKAGLFIANEYATDEDDHNGEWLAPQARPIYAAICEALGDDARKLEAMGQDPGATFATDPDRLRDDAHERQRLEKEDPWKE